jgi:hypothetical protein
MKKTILIVKFMDKGHKYDRAKELAEMFLFFTQDYNYDLMDFKFNLYENGNKISNK